METSVIFNKKNFSKRAVEICTILSASANKVIGHLEKKLEVNYSFGVDAKDIACYFKSPMMFLIANKPQLASGILQYIKSSFMTTDGDFKTTENLKSINPAYIEYWSYINGWVIRAANQLEMAEISHLANKYFRQYYLGEIEGFSTNQINQYPQISDVLTVSHHGLVNFEMGNMSIAISAGNYLCQALTKQINLKKGFYLRQNKVGDLITDLPGEKTPFYFISSTEPNQLYFMIGYPAAYLAILYKKTRKPEFLISAINYLDFALSCDGSVYACDYSHKIAWASSLIYESTGNEKYLDVIGKISSYFIHKQEKNGMWFGDDINHSYDQSAEIACWFFDIVKNIHFSYQVT